MIMPMTDEDEMINLLFYISPQLPLHKIILAIIVIIKFLFQLD